MTHPGVDLPVVLNCLLSLGGAVVAFVTSQVEISWSSTLIPSVPVLLNIDFRPAFCMVSVLVWFDYLDAKQEELCFRLVWCFSDFNVSEWIQSCKTLVPYWYVFEVYYVLY